MTRATYSRRRVVVGIDPGSQTGMWAVLVPDVGPATDPAAWRHVGRCTVRSSALKRPPTTGEARLFAEVRAMLEAWRPALVVMEEPVDGMPKWGGASRGTAFSLGKAYGLVYAAACAGRVHAPGSIVTYTVNPVKPGRSRRARDGWMPQVKTGNLPHAQARTKTLEDLRALGLELHRRPASGVIGADAARGITEHEAMALGVMRHHLVERQGLGSGD